MTAKPPSTSRARLWVVLDSNRALSGPSRYDVKPDEWCSDYRCSGDCGLLGHGNQPHTTPQYKRATLAAFDALKADDRRKQFDAAQEVRRKAKDAL